jgi:hypothetical protein
MRAATDSRCSRNPALSAIDRRGMRPRRMAACTREMRGRGRVRTRGGWARGWSVVGWVWTRGGVGRRRDAGCGANDRRRVGEGGGCVMRWPAQSRCSRHPALSAIGRRGVSPTGVATWTREPRGRERVRGSSAVIVDLSGIAGHRGKQGARVPRDGAPRTSSGPEGSSDKGNATGATVSPGSLFHLGGSRQGTELRAQGTGHKSESCVAYRARGTHSWVPGPNSPSASRLRSISIAVLCPLRSVPGALGGGCA